MKPDTAHPIAAGTHVMVVRSDDPLLPVGAVGITTGSYQPILVSGPDGLIKRTWVYPCDFPRHPPHPDSSGWCAVHRSIVPLAPPAEPADETRQELREPQRLSA